MARVAAVALTAALLAACSSGDDTSGADTTAAGGAASTGATAETTSGDGGTTRVIDEERCEANRAAGTITYLSSFDFAAAAGILDVVVAEEKGYFDQVCLDVELKPSLSTANFPLVAAGQAQMSVAGSYTELLNFSKSGGRFVAVVQWGKTPVEALLVRDDGAFPSLADLQGATIGVKGDIPPSLVAMLNGAGLGRGTDYDEVLLDGFDPRAHLEQDIDALPVYKSNEPGQLDAAGVSYRLFDPTAEGIPGSFGVLYTSAEFLAEHPTAVEDFVRAVLKGFDDAVADPSGAVALSLQRIEAAGNQAFLTQEGEEYRWSQESALVIDSTPDGQRPGLVDGDRLEAEVRAYAEADVFGDAVPSTDGTYDESVARAVIAADGSVVWGS